MTHQEILEKAIKKAVKQGWAEGIKYLDAFYQLQDVKDFKDYQYGAFIFNHDFAKALWGEEKHDSWTDEDGGTYTCGKCDGGDVLGTKTRATLKEPLVSYGIEYCWEWHLQQMVISEDPIKYLGDNI